MMRLLLARLRIRLRHLFTNCRDISGNTLRLAIALQSQIDDTALRLRIHTSQNGR